MPLSGTSLAMLDFGVTARNTIEQIAAEGNQVAFSSITLAEIVYLSERGRIDAATLDRLLRAKVKGHLKKNGFPEQTYTRPPLLLPTHPEFAGQSS